MMHLLSKTALGVACYSLLVSLADASFILRRQTDDSDVTYAGCEDSLLDDPASSCGALVCYANYGYNLFYASFAMDCLATVPFNADVALRFIEYYNTTMQFQSTSAYLRDPPAGYQQPAVDFFQELAGIKSNVTEGRYVNEYEFEAEIMRLVYSFHDSHVVLWSGVLSAFAFGNDYRLVTASMDGREAPKVYLQEDVIKYRDSGSVATISPVATIDGVEVTQFLRDFAALNSPGLLEPHADWNHLMSSPVQSILGVSDVFSAGATFYPGDNLTITFENGTSPINDNWYAFYINSDYTGPLRTGGDFYNYFVLGLLPASYNEVPLPQVFNYTFASGEDLADYTVANWSGTTQNAYPSDPITVQAGLAAGGLGGWVTGYVFDDISTGVLSIPSFDQYGQDVASFYAAVSFFLGNISETNTQKVIVDLQGNAGGNILLALTTFATFFPELQVLTPSRRRIHPLADIVGNATTAWWSELPPEVDFNNTGLKYYYDANEWNVDSRLNAETGQNFTSWDEYRGPVLEHGDMFSLVERYDLGNIAFQSSFFDGWYSNFTPSSENSKTWQPSDIVLLTDGQCGSACALFHELMSYQAGVRSVVVGGQPSAGPMQAASGSRGAIQYSGDALDADFQQTNNITGNATIDVLPRLDAAGYRDTGVWTSYTGFTLRDQVRGDDAANATPLQFSYLAADCRLYFTLANVYNMSQLWRDTYTAAWVDPSLCVANSTGYSTTGNVTASHDPPVSTAAAAGLPDLRFSDATNTSATASDGNGAFQLRTIQTCLTDDACGSWACYPNVLISCGIGSTSESLCLPSCDTRWNNCGSYLSCKPKAGRTSGLLSGFSASAVGGRQSSSSSAGVCVPTDGRYFSLCPSQQTSGIF